jgi:hypothetical protein
MLKKNYHQGVAKRFYLLSNAATCFGLNFWPSSGELSLACAAYVSSRMLEIQHLIKIIVLLIRNYSSLNQ